MNLKYIFNNNYRGTVYTKFIDTKDFEVYCFHQISISNKNIIFNKEHFFEKTNFFLVGGYDKTKRKGKIRLYEVLNYENLEVEIIDSIKYDEFKGPISCINQLGDPEFIILSCWDGNIYFYNLFIPNLYYDEKIENKSFYDFFF